MNYIGHKAEQMKDSADLFFTLNITSLRVRVKDETHITWNERIMKYKKCRKISLKFMLKQSSNAKPHSMPQVEIENGSSHKNFRKSNEKNSEFILK